MKLQELMRRRIVLRGHKPRSGLKLKWFRWAGNQWIVLRGHKPRSGLKLVICILEWQYSRSPRPQAAERIETDLKISAYRGILSSPRPQAAERIETLGKQFTTLTGMVLRGHKPRSGLKPQPGEQIRESRHVLRGHKPRSGLKRRLSPDLTGLWWFSAATSRGAD